MSEPTDIKSAREKKQKKEAVKAAQPLKLKRREVLDSLLDVLDRSPLSLLPPLPEKLHMLAPDASSGQRVILANNGHDEVRRVDDRYAAALLRKYVKTDLMGLSPQYQLSIGACEALIDDWKGTCRDLVKVADVLWLDEPGLTYRRLPWPKGVNGPTPDWDALLARMGDHRAAFMAFVGSLLDPKADMQQYLYLYGQGGDGKGTIMRMLEKTLGQAYKSEVVPAKDDRFWTAGLIGKRLVAFPDSNAATFMRGGLFKSLLGGDSQRIEGKWKESYSTHLNAKFMFSSNKKPNLSSSEADLRRALFIEMPRQAYRIDPGYEQRLWSQTGAFLTRCSIVYRELCPHHGPIPYDKTDLLEHISTVEEDFDVFAEQTFSFFPLLEGERSKDRRFAVPEQVNERLRLRFKSNKEIEDFREWLKRTHGVEKKQVKISSTEIHWRYIGCELKIVPFR